MAVEVEEEVEEEVVEEVEAVEGRVAEEAAALRQGQGWRPRA